MVLSFLLGMVFCAILIACVSETVGYYKDLAKIHKLEDEFRNR